MNYILSQKIFTMKTLIPFPSWQPNSTFNGFLVHSKLDTLDSSAKSVEKISCDIFDCFGFGDFWLDVVPVNGVDDCSLILMCLSL